jgi:hypothetical protein
MHPAPTTPPPHTQHIGPSGRQQPGLCASQHSRRRAPAVAPCAAQNPSTQQLAVSTLCYSATVALGTTGKLCVGTYAGTGGSSSQQPNTTMPPAQQGHHQDTKYQATVAETGPRAPTTRGLWVDKNTCIGIDRPHKQARHRCNSQLLKNPQPCRCANTTNPISPATSAVLDTPTPPPACPYSLAAGATPRQPCSPAASQICMHSTQQKCWGACHGLCLPEVQADTPDCSTAQVLLSPETGSNKHHTPPASHTSPRQNIHNS